MNLCGAHFRIFSIPIRYLLNFQISLFTYLADAALRIELFNWFKSLLYIALCGIFGIHWCMCVCVHKMTILLTFLPLFLFFLCVHFEASNFVMEIFCFCCIFQFMLPAKVTVNKQFAPSPIYKCVSSYIRRISVVVEMCVWFLHATMTFVYRINMISFWKSFICSILIAYMHMHMCEIF